MSFLTYKKDNFIPHIAINLLNNGLLYDKYLQHGQPLVQAV